MAEKAKILIVDDNPHVLKLLSISLQKAGFEVYTAENGDQGFEKVNEVKPDLVISDVMMPQTDGIEFCWMVRENSEIPMVPFIFLTSLSDQDMEIRGFRAGADEYLVKPVDRKVLLEKVETLLGRAQKVKKVENEQVSQMKGFEGNLADLSLVEMIQLLNLNKRSGRMDVMAEKKGEIFFNKGEMIYARVNNDILGKEAINKLVTYKTGMFRFEPVSSPDVKPNIEGSTMNVLLEACRLMDEASSGQQS
ncbi:MAG: response regulator [Calditrichaeota bacterium]|nr:response regulator [Calditrichota bacterium]RQW08432.1 MAG: response regulator [Calditrichota bacterium]